ncbi:MAG: type I-U CRISPR-associated protein Csx17 [Armatimonadota bacterium]|nr:type I-U CRISPR-associated protein Csx17 [Armatimonadota bacterium]
MPEVRLSGCQPEPLASYLKALGVLKVVGEQGDPEAVGWWDGHDFVLAGKLSKDELVRFFSQDYRPTPILAPWNKDSGFYRTDTAIEAIERTTDPRLKEFRRAIEVARQVLDEFGWSTAPGSGTEKMAFVAALRSRLPDGCLEGLDAMVALVGDDLSWAPLFVAGGVDGRFEFTRRYAESVLAALDIAGGRRCRGGRRSSRGTSAPSSAPGLRMALFGEPEPGVAEEDTGGLLAPGSVDAPNASEGFVGPKRLNPWNYVLALEGAVVLAGSVSRRFGSNLTRAAFPFAVSASAAGHAGVGTEASRGEVWLPLWEQPLTAREARQLFREGRAEWAGRLASTAADMARALVSLGVDRGLREFRRYGIQGRSGRSYLAVALGRWPVVARPEAPLLAQLDEFLGELRVAASRRNAPAALTDALRRVDAAILNYTAFGSRDRLIEVLVATSQAEHTLARRPGARRGGTPRPLPGLSPDWVGAVDDGSVEFELAAAVASLKPAESGPGPFRRHLEPLLLRRGRWEWADTVPHEVVWSGRDVLLDMAAVLERRLVDAARESVVPPLDGWVRAHPSAVAALVEGEVDLARLARLCEALTLVNWRDAAGGSWLSGRRYPSPVGASSYPVLKLVLLGRPFQAGEVQVVIRPDQTTLGLLRAGNVWGAAARAARRLRAAGLSVRGIPDEGASAPIRQDPELGQRLLAALLVPVWEAPLLRQALVEEERLEEVGA